MRQAKTDPVITARGGKGQASIEYVLMLGSVIVILAAFMTAFHTDIVRFFFTFIGELLVS